MAEGGVAHGRVDLEVEQIADAAHVAARGVDLLEDPVLSQRPRFDVRLLPGEQTADGYEAGSRATSDEQVGEAANWLCVHA